MDEQTQRRGTALAIGLGIVAMLLSVAATVIDWVKGNDFNPTSLGGIVVGLIVISAAMQRRKGAGR